MSNDETLVTLKRLTADLDHSPSDAELKALLAAIATVIGFEGEGWLKLVESSSVVADFKLDRLPPDEMMPNFVSILCIRYELSKSLHLAGLAGKYSLKPGDGCHILRIGDFTSNQKPTS
jgi:hypothetical protein